MREGKNSISYGFTKIRKNAVHVPWPRASWRSFERGREVAKIAKIAKIAKSGSRLIDMASHPESRGIWGLILVLDLPELATVEAHEDMRTKPLCGLSASRGRLSL